MMWCNVAGIVSTWTFNDPPTYAKPATINLTFSISALLSLLPPNFSSLIILLRYKVMIFAAGANMFYLNRQNTLRAAEKAEIARSGAPVVESEEERLRLGDRHRDFVYTL